MAEIKIGDALPIAAVVLDGRTLTVEWVNELGMDMLSRLMPRQILGVPFMSSMTGNAAIDVEKAMNSVRETGEPVHLATTIEAPEFLHHLRASLYRLPSDKVLVLLAHPSVFARPRPADWDDAGTSGPPVR